MSEVMALQTLFNLRKRGLLTADHIRAARAFLHHGPEMDLPKNVHTVLAAIIVEGKGLEALEKENRWPARSAKALLEFALNIVLETQNVDEPREEQETSAANYLGAADADDNLLDIMGRMGLTATEARIYEILRRDPKGFVTREELLCRLYADQDEDMPDDRNIDVFMCKLRKKLEPFGYEIAVIRSVGYALRIPAIVPQKPQTIDPTNPTSGDDADMVDYMTASPEEAAIAAVMVRYSLTKTEARIFNAMAGAFGGRISRDGLLAKVYPNAADLPDAGTLDVHICKLRKKLKPYGISIRLLWGWGWEVIFESQKVETSA